MPSERVQRRIDRLLDQADEALEANDWQKTVEICRAVLKLEHNNEDAASYLDAALDALGAGSPSEATTASTAPISSSSSAELPISFANGRYEVKSLLGEGGKKKVYLAHDITLDRDVAFGLIKAEGLDADSRQRITREAQAMARLGDHPNLMPIFDLGDENGQPYMVQPLMVGGDVESLISEAEDGRLTLEDALRISSEICRGLEFAHAKGIIHRDLKPGNVWLTDDGTVRIGDFGLALSIDRSRLTQEKMIVGTVSYMPPEQATGGEITPQADLYSLGAMLYEMVTGRPPFMGDDDIAIIGQHINTPPVAPQWHNPEIPAQLDSLIMRLLSKNPGERPESAADVLSAIGAIEISAAPSPQPSPGGRGGTSEAATGSLDSMASGVFVGRHAETDQLKAKLENALSGRGGMVALVGEPGIGKTRTALELETYAGLRNAQVLWGRCYEGTGAPPYWPWVQAIRSYVASHDPDDVRREMGSTASVISEIVDDVKNSLPDLQPPPQLDDPESARFRLFDSIATFLKNAANVKPILLILDDLHWADKPSLLLLEFVARELASSRVMLIGTYRDMELNRRHPLTITLGDLMRERLFERVLLRGLTREDVGRFIELAAGVNPPDGLIDAIHTQTEGNPLFVTETVRLFVQEGELTPENLASRDSWSIRTPEGVREVIGRRLDKLSDRTNAVLTDAAVIGRQFTLDELGAVAEDTSHDRLLDVIDEGLDARVIEEFPGEVGQYQFSHAVIQQTLGDELSLTRRVRVHARIAEAFENLYADDLASQAETLAYHFEQAQTILGTEKMIEYSIIAGETALAAIASQDAKTHFETALSGIGDSEIDERHARALLGLGWATAGVVEASGLQTAFDTIMKAFDYYDSIGDSSKVIEIASRQIGRQSEIRGSVELADRALKYLEPGNADSLPILISKAGAHWFERRDGEAAVATLEIAQSILDTNPSDRVMTGFLATRSAISNFDSRDEVLARLKDAEDAVNLSVAGSDPAMEMRAHLFAALLNYLLGQMAEAKSSGAELVEVSRRFGMPSYGALGLAWGALANMAIGEWESIAEACELLEEISGDGSATALRMSVDAFRGFEIDHEEAVTRAVGEFSKTPRGAPVWFGVLVGNIQLMHPDISLAQDVWEQIDAQMRGRFGVLGAKIALSAIRAVLDRDPAAARPVYEEMRGRKGLYWILSFDWLLGLLSRVMGELDQAEEHFEDAIQFLRENGITVDLAWTSFDYAEMLLERDAPGDREKATELQDEAIAIATELGMKPLLERVLAQRSASDGLKA